jgi:hypothetical protein
MSFLRRPCSRRPAGAPCSFGAVVRLAGAPSRAGPAQEPGRPGYCQEIEQAIVPGPQSGSARACAGQPPLGLGSSRPSLRARVAPNPQAEPKATRPSGAKEVDFCEDPEAACGRAGRVRREQQGPAPTSAAAARRRARHPPAAAGAPAVGGPACLAPQFSELLCPLSLADVMLKSFPSFLRRRSPCFAPSRCLAALPGSSPAPRLSLDRF